MKILRNRKTLPSFDTHWSPRLISSEIDLLIENFDGQVWKENQKIQSLFFRKIFDSEIHFDEEWKLDLNYFSKSRILETPKALGFVNLEPRIELTDAGNKLLSGKRTSEVIARQLLKFQLPSPYHTDKNNRFFVKPYVELLWLVYELDGLSKTEIALFFSQLTHLDKYETVKEKILTFRKERQEVKTNRKEFVHQRFAEEIEEIFSEEIESKGYRTRESADTTRKKFFKTKHNNMRDYADAFIRYLRATELVTFNARQARLVISKFKKDEVLFILKNTQRKPANFSKTADFKKYLFDSTVPALLTDNKKLLTEKISKLDKSKVSFNLDTEKLKDVLSELEEKHKMEVVQSERQKLKTYEDLPDILEVFERIKNKDLPDAPLFLEWNIWRAMTMLNYGQIDGNFVIDIDGAPLSTAAANRPDIECEYENFKLIIEVTMSSGHKQYEMEGEPVARHYGNVKRESEKPVYCLFVAPKVSEGTLTYYFSQNQINTKFYGGKTQIVPMNLETFIEFTKIGVKNKFSQTRILEKFFSKAIEKNLSVENEEIWFNNIEKMAKNWTSLN